MRWQTPWIYFHKNAFETAFYPSLTHSSLSYWHVSPLFSVWWYPSWILFHAFVRSFVLSKCVTDTFETLRHKAIFHAWHANTTYLAWCWLCVQFLTVERPNLFREISHSASSYFFDVFGLPLSCLLLSSFQSECICHCVSPTIVIHSRCFSLKSYVWSSKINYHSYSETCFQFPWHYSRGSVVLVVGKILFCSFFEILGGLENSTD